MPIPSTCNTPSTLLTWNVAASRLVSATYRRLFCSVYTMDGMEIFRQSIGCWNMFSFMWAINRRTLAPSWKKMMTRQLENLRNSAEMTADVAMNMSPSRVRTKRMTKMSIAFCSVSKTRLTYFSESWRPARVYKNKSEVVFLIV